ncbi:UDP-4-amino-4,6-dideoxy-N-acetyl-beta-L-altrosamine transaminase [Maridesulfovibrio ferrireducens]|uniref:UDP-4-amino-4, 6-dideoxy-N-acetyl-beta-L-altrosamine transaminase n=1 Tax=Maridesulfovibrio ferrireducens TaxID=246191 RepID=UPI001A351CB3|nr:UDP-4-amino-4,6-dideoxy-N-acetyl-beta-L-altrosamine transaminase [Maridesulfovibrio ferrireducens]MBI9112687.1 UDP-4-amino-4,6-dideoxy-N-acetyl-beta-L-altrosamine transaminase [Maridesulfovibrio ferrireducens]
MGNPKKIPYGCQSIDEHDLKAVADALTSGWLTTGPKVSEFEQAIAKLSNVAHGVAVNSGTAALHAAMYAFEVKEGDEVIVPPMTFAASANCVAYMGATPIFADVDPDTLLISPEKVEQLITPKTKGIIAVDYAGQPCDYDALRTIADKHGLFLAADACHSIGGNLNGKMVGSLADISLYSFHPVKHMTTGEGGMAVTDNPEYDRRMRIFRNHGITADFRQRDGWFYEMEDLGFNYRLTDFQCALGLSQLEKLEQWIERRREIADLYAHEFAEIKELAPLGLRPGAHHAYHLYVIRLKGSDCAPKRKALFDYLRENGLGVQVHYIPVHMHPYYQKTFGTHEGMCPVAEEAYNGIISLPMFPLMEDADVRSVTSTIKTFLAGNL